MTWWPAVHFWQAKLYTKYTVFLGLGQAFITLSLWMNMFLLNAWLAQSREMISNLGCNASFLFPFISDYIQDPLGKEITNLTCFSQTAALLNVYKKWYLWGWVLVAFGDDGHPEQVRAQLPIPTIDLKRRRRTSVNKTQTSGKHRPQQGRDKCKSVRPWRWCTKQSYLHLYFPVHHRGAGASKGSLPKTWFMLQMSL